MEVVFPVSNTKTETLGTFFYFKKKKGKKKREHNNGDYFLMLFFTLGLKANRNYR